MEKCGDPRRSHTAATEEIKIRDAAEADLPAIVEIHNETIASRISTAQLDPVTVEGRREWFRAHSPTQYPIWVADLDGAIAGWLIATRSSSAFMSANNFGAVAWAEDCCRKRSRAARSWGSTRSLD